MAAPAPVHKRGLSLLDRWIFWTSILDRDTDMHTFAYLRVSRSDLTTENQRLALAQAGFTDATIYAETVSGAVAARDRPEFARLLDTVARVRGPKQLVVTKLDRLGRDAGDIMGTVATLRDLGCAVHVLQLRGVDLTSAAGKLVLATLAALAEVERDILIERTMAGLERARSEGKHLGRPKTDAWADAEQIRRRLDNGESVSAIAREYGASRATVIRIRADSVAAAH